MIFSLKLPCHSAHTLPICGDYYFALGLASALEKLGQQSRLDPHDEWDTNRQDGEIEIVIRGQHPYQKQTANPVVYWLISSADRTPLEELRTADHIFVASKPLTDKLMASLGSDHVTLLPQAFDAETMHFQPNEKVSEDVVFVGMRRAFTRPVVQHALDCGIDIDLYGNGWTDTPAEKFLKGGRVPNDQLSDMYGKAAAVLNDHTPEMREAGLCSNRIFDVLACGTPVVSDDVAWVPDDIKEWVYFFSDADSYTLAVSSAVNEAAEKRSRRAEFTKKFRLEHSFDSRASKIIAVLKEKGFLMGDDNPPTEQSTGSRKEVAMTMTETVKGSSVHGAFVNLADSARRREQCEKFLYEFDLQDFYSRFEGIQGADYCGQYKQSGLSSGKIGCWLSHMQAIKASCEHDHHFHLLEDDFELTSKFPDLIENFDEYTANLTDWDILFTDFTLTNLRNVNDMKGIIDKVNRLQQENRFVIEDATHLYAAGNSSYIVNRNSKKKVADILEKGLGAKMPKDIYLREQARLGNLKIFVTLPFLTTLNDTFMESDILGKIDDRNPSIINNVIFRKSLSWGADTQSLLKLIKKRIASQKPISDRGMIYTHLVAHYVSDEYQNY